MKFSLWQALAFTSLVSVAIFFRTELALILSPVLDFAVVFWAVVFCLSLAVVYRVIPPIRRWYYSVRSPVWRIADSMSRDRHRPLTYAILRYGLVGQRHYLREVLFFSGQGPSRFPSPGNLFKGPTARSLIKLPGRWPYGDSTI